MDPRTNLFARFAAGVVRMRWLVIILVAIATFGLVGQTRDLSIDSSNEIWLVDDDPQLDIMEKFTRLFRNDDFVYVLVESDDFFQPEIIRRFGALAEELERRVPYVADVTWLGNAEFIEGREDEVEIYELMADFPATPAAMADVKKKALGEPLYINTLISPDARVAGLMLEMGEYPADRVDPRKEIGPAVHAVLADPEYAGLDLHVVGGPIMDYEIDRLTGREAKLLLPLCLALQVGILFWIGHGLLGVVVPISIVSLSVVWTFGMIGVYGYSLNLFVIIIPILLICVGMGDAMHVVAEVRARRSQGLEPRAAVVAAMGTVGLPCLLTTLTTAAGFLAFCAAPIRPFRQMGIYCATGVTLALVLTYLLTPVFYSWGRPRSAERAVRVAASSGDRFDRVLMFVHRLVCGHPRAIIATFCALGLVAIVGALRVEVESTTIELFSRDVPLRQAYEYVDEKMGGSMSIEIMLDTGEEGGITEPHFLARLAALERFVEEQPIAAKTTSVLDILRQMRRAFHENRPEYYSIPETRQEASQYLLLYEMSGGADKAKVTTYGYDVARLTVRTHSLDSKDVAVFLGAVEDFSEDLFGADVNVEFAGLMPWEKIMNDRIASGQRASMFAAVIVIAAIMMIVLRSVPLGLISMIPNVFPVVMMLGLMGFAGVYMDLGVTCIGAIIIGVAVDDTIHFFMRYRREFTATRDYAGALRATLSSVGRPILFTTLTLTLGFSVLIFSDAIGMVKFGFLAGFAFMWALLADFFLSPALLIVLQPLGPESACGVPATLPVDERVEDWNLKPEQRAGSGS